MKVNIDKEELRQKLLKGYTQEQLAVYFNCGTSTIKRRKKEYGLVGVKTNKKPLTVEELNKIDKLCKEGYTLKDIAKEVDRATNTLIKYLPKEIHEEVLKNTNVYRANIQRKGTLDNIFNPSKFSAYITGYLQADGCISKTGQITAVSKDIELIYLCAKFFNTSILTTGDYYKFNITDFTKTEKFKAVTNIAPNKTYTKYEIPDWILSNEEFLNYFIVGVFNGDGWAYEVKNRAGVVELGIVQHINQVEYLEILAKYLGWNIYTKPESCSIQTKNLAAVKNFSDIYLLNEFSLSRKKLKILTCKDIV